MEQEEFNKAFQLGVDTNGRGITGPTKLFGYETERETKESLVETFSAPLRAETHIYRISVTETRLVGINAKSKDHADRILERRLSAGQLCEEYLGELNELLQDTDQEASDGGEIDG